MPMVDTIMGPVDVNALGFTLTHEHIRQSSAGVPYTFPELFDHDADVARSVAVLNQAASEGVGTIVDCYDHGFGTRYAAVTRGRTTSGSKHNYLHGSLERHPWQDCPCRLGSVQHDTSGPLALNNNCLPIPESRVSFHLQFEWKVVYQNTGNMHRHTTPREVEINDNGGPYRPVFIRRHGVMTVAGVSWGQDSHCLQGP